MPMPITFTNDEIIESLIKTGRRNDSEWGQWARARDRLAGGDDDWTVDASPNVFFLNQNPIKLRVHERNTNVGANGRSIHIVTAPRTCGVVAPR